MLKDMGIKANKTDKQAFEPEAESGIRGSNDGTYIYQADVYCHDCAVAIAQEIDNAGQGPAEPEDEHSYDSDDYPKGPFFDEESDSPEHCAGCRKFLENPLTDHGYAYLNQMIGEHDENGRGDANVIETWKAFYPERSAYPNYIAPAEEGEFEENHESTDKEATMDKEAVTLDELKQQEETRKQGPTSGEDEGFNVKVTYVKGGIKLSATPSLLEDVLEHGFPGNDRECFTWEPGRRVARRDDTQN